MLENLVIEDKVIVEVKAITGNIPNRYRKGKYVFLF